MPQPPGPGSDCAGSLGEAAADGPAEPRGHGLVESGDRRVEGDRVVDVARPSPVDEKTWTPRWFRSGVPLVTRYSIRSFGIASVTVSSKGIMPLRESFRTEPTPFGSVSPSLMRSTSMPKSGLQVLVLGEPLVEALDGRIEVIGLVDGRHAAAKPTGSSGRAPGARHGAWHHRRGRLAFRTEGIRCDA